MTKLINPLIIIAVFLMSFILGGWFYKTTECKKKLKELDSHIVETANFIPSYERDWREKYR